MPVLDDGDFGRFQDLIYQVSGIYLAKHKRSLLVGRLTRRLRQLGLRSFREYYGIVVDREDELWCMLDLITTNETRFFREPKHFDLLVERLLPEWCADAARGLRPKRLRIWSAGCATGEEPYSIAMVLRHWFPPTTEWSLEVFATDLSVQVLRRAREGVYPLGHANDIPIPYRNRFLLRGAGQESGRIKIATEVSSLVNFQRLNLNDGSYPFIGRFDAIFCRNVLIYFGSSAKVRVIDQLLDQLVPGGSLFIGHAETLSGITARASRVIPTVYALDALANQG
jgi:chemotaxis protein methyltransferase CheR